MPPEYESLDEIERAYNKLIKVAQQEDDTDKVSTLRAELADRKADFREQQLVQRERASWKKMALAQYPLAKDFEDMVVGDSEEAITARAKQLHERLAAAQPPQPTPQDQARAAYGTPAAVGGGQPAPMNKDRNTERIEQIAAKFNRGEPLTRQEVHEFEIQRGGRRMAEAIAAAGKRWTEKDLPWLSGER